MLQFAPDESQLSRMYFELSRAGAHCSGENLPWPYAPQNLEALLALGSEMSRYDPRLLGILVEYFAKHWTEVSPQRLRGCYPDMETPQTVAVVVEFAKEAAPNAEMRYFFDYLQKGLKPVPSQWYFRGLYSPGGSLAHSAAEQNLTQYQRWGFFGREYPTIDVFKKKTVGRLTVFGRLSVLRKLFEKQAELRIGDYLKALNQGVTRKQAFLDLGKVARLKRGSKGRGAKWVLK